MAKDRLVPSDPAAEEAVLGSILLDPHARAEVIDLLPTGAAFFHNGNGLIYDTMLRLPAIDYLTMTSELEKKGQLTEIGGASYLSKLVNATPTSIHARHYAGIVMRTFQLRRLLELPTMITDTIYSEASDVEEVWGRIKTMLDAVAPESKSKDTLEWRESVTWYMELQMQRVENNKLRQEGKLREVTLPWPDLVKVIPRLRPGTVMLVAAESGRGKTAFAENCAEYWAENGLNVVFVHLEISHEGMLDRRARRHTDLSTTELDCGVGVEHFTSLGQTMYDWPGTITYIHAPGWTASKIVAAIEKRVSRHPVDAIVIDYLTKIIFERGNPLKLTSAQARGQQMEAIKSLAERLAIPALVLSQFNRAGEIRDTGEAEEKVNYYIRIEREKDEPIGDVKVEKNTWGPLRDTQLYFRGEKYLWQSLTKAKAPVDIREERW